MRLDELKKGFWGYKKESVYRYIVSLEEEVSEKLEQEEEQSKKVKGELRQRLSELENALKEAQKENEAMGEKQLAVSNTLREAQKFKENSFRREQECREDLDAAVEEKLRELDTYFERIWQIIKIFQGLLEEMDGKAEILERKMKILDMQAPVTNLSLFQRKSETEEQEKESWKKSSSM